MKNIIRYYAILLCGLLAFASCSDDRDSNPKLQSPTTFTLNAPIYGSSAINLATSTALNFAWSQPEYGFPAIVDYQIELSLNDSWRVSTKEAWADKTGKTVADYATLDDTYNICNAQVGVAKIARSLEMIAKWEDGKVPPTQKVYARCKATYAGQTIYSNSVEFMVVPYYVEVKEHEPVLWYLTGSCFGNGAWGNGEDQLGISMVPMYPIAGQEYDINTGTGVIGYIGYFPEKAIFKIIEKLGNWDFGICGNGGPLTTTYRAGGNDPGNIQIDEAGYYEIRLNTKTHECKIEKTTPASSIEFTKMSLPIKSGADNNWDATQNEMRKFSTTANTKNHDWVLDVNVTAGQELQFIANGALTDTWSASNFPFGTAVKGNKVAISVKESGKYKVFFNDITGQYYFLK